MELLSLFGFLETKYTQNNLLPFRSHIKVKAKLSSPLLSWSRFLWISLTINHNFGLGKTPGNVLTSPCKKTNCKAGSDSYSRYCMFYEKLLQTFDPKQTFHKFYWVLFCLLTSIFHHHITEILQLRSKHSHQFEVQLIVINYHLNTT